jgi:hypothetical protein
MLTHKQNNSCPLQVGPILLTTLPQLSEFSIDDICKPPRKHTPFTTNSIKISIDILITASHARFGHTSCQASAKHWQELRSPQGVCLGMCSCIIYGLLNRLLSIGSACLYASRNRVNHEPSEAKHINDSDICAWSDDGCLRGHWHAP